MAINGQLGYYKLADWWFSTFTASEREYIEQVYQPLGGKPGERPLTQVKITSADKRSNRVLWGLAGWFKKTDDRHIARRILAKAEKLAISESDVIGLHFTYSQMVQVYYKDRATDSTAFDLAVESCEKQIAIAPKVIEAFRKEEQARDKLLRSMLKSASSSPKIPFVLPSHVGFEQLVIILEKQGEYDRAIELCKLANQQGWDGDWDKRIDRCKKKLQKK